MDALYTKRQKNIYIYMSFYCVIFLGGVAIPIANLRSLDISKNVWVELCEAEFDWFTPLKNILEIMFMNDFFGIL